MLIAKTEKELIEIIELMEKYQIDSCYCGQEQLTFESFHIKYKHNLSIIGFEIKLERKNKDNFFKFLHERKNEEEIKIPGETKLFNFKYFLEKHYKTKFEEVPGVESNTHKK